jgi:chromosome segregation ATPase
VIKAAQKREELQRYGDELDAKIRKAEREIKALTRTLEHLKSRNWNYRNQFVDPEKKNKNEDKKKQWEEQVREAGKEKARLEKKIKGLVEEKNIRIEQYDQLKNDANNMKNRLIEVNSVLEEKDQEIEVMNNDLQIVKQECGQKEAELQNKNISYSQSKLKQAEIQLLQD